MKNIPFKSKLTKFRNIENRNKAFDKLTDRQKRQEIAFDALNLMLLGKIEADHGTYWGYALLNKADTTYTSQGLQELLVKELPVCHVCARGAMMVSQIRLGNSVDPFDSDASCGSEENLKGFSIEDFLKMEREFEHDAYGTPYDMGNPKLANILCNVIKNGNFKPDDKTDYLVKWNLNIKE